MKTITKSIQPYSKLPTGEFINLSRDHAGQLLILMSSNSVDNHEYTDSIGYAKKSLTTYQIWQTTDNSSALSLYAKVTAEVDFHNVQRFINGDLLLVNRFSQYRNENDYGKNGYIYSINGRLKQKILLGDGIAEVQVTENDIIWVSYFDQGILGRYSTNWYDLIGSTGLVAWNIDGKKVYEFEPSDSLYAIEDCYALNVIFDATTYAYYFYTDDNDCGEFDLVHIQNQQISNYWHMPVFGSGAFIVDGDKAVFDGGYEHRTLFYLVELQKAHKAQIIQQVTFEYSGENILETGNSFSYPWARGDSFVVIKDSHLFLIPFTEFFS